MKRKPLILGNWKMHKNISGSLEFAGLLNEKAGSFKNVDFGIAAPATLLKTISDAREGWLIGAQNIYWEEKGAFTGEISPIMAKDAGCDFTLIGHSERRQLFSETDEWVNKKLKSCIKNGLKAVVCVGETLSEREANLTMTTIDKQLVNGLNSASVSPETVIVAYEPVWAIGTGKNATPAQAEEVHGFIRKRLSEIFGNDMAEAVLILYGGSVKPDNTGDLLKMPNIDGGLVGGASLDINSFIEMIKAVDNQGGN